MSEEVGEVVATEEVGATEGTEEEVVSLPSDNPEFEVPEKFAGKSIEDVIKSYQELEKMKVNKSEEEVVKEISEGDEKTPKKEVEEAQYQKYADSLDKNGELSAAEYEELATAGYDKAAVDTEIKRRSDLQDFEEYRRDKALSDVLEPLGGGKDKFKEVADWANANKTPEEVKNFNETLASVPKIAQQAMLKQLYTEYEGSGEEGGTILHTNTPQTTPSKGYTSEADFFKDLGSPDYKTHKSFAKAVEAKLAKTNTEGWSIG